MSQRSLFSLLLLSCLIGAGFSNVYLHNPRGSNNRLDHARREVRNPRRLFDSDNNNRGGYVVGSLQYYAGSILPIEWTNQHSCSMANNNCEIIIQYMCGDHVKDGIELQTIPDKPINCKDQNCNTDQRYGTHETYEDYLSCSLRERNSGLFLAEQTMKGRTAKHTRQDGRGHRYGYECPEERDYYPYWHPTAWKDIVILTNSVQRCPYYKSESQNVKSRFACVAPPAYYTDSGWIRTRNPIPITKEDCEDFHWPKGDQTAPVGEWKEIPAHGLPAPICRQSMWSRDNHNGNGNDSTNPNSYEWRVPDIAEKNCVLRIRYNISSNDYKSWETFSDANGTPESSVNIASLVGLSTTAATQRGYVFKNTPEVTIFRDNSKFKLRLAINTAQFGRTFQDRSHAFSILPRPDDLQSAVIHNLNVRGKRGNIVQVYPAVEYDFVPIVLTLSAGHYVHIQWTGSNHNDRGNNGQGLRGSDRSNMLLLHKQNYPEGISGISSSSGPTHGHWGNSYPMHLNDSTFIDLSREDLEKLAINRGINFRGDMDLLNDAGTYFNLGPRKVTSAGIYNYLCTRNNNFSNRSQKGKIVVLPNQSDAAISTDNQLAEKVEEDTMADTIEQEDETVQDDRMFLEDDGGEVS